MRIRRNNIQLTLMAAVVLMMTTGCSNRQESLQLVEADAAAILEAVEGQSGSQAVLVNYWATWCKPCVDEFPMIVELDGKYSQEGLETYFVSVDFSDAKSQVRDFLEKQGVKGLSFIKTEGGDNEFIDAISKKWTGAVPFTIVYGKHSGAIIDLWEGAESAERFDGAIRQALSN